MSDYSRKLKRKENRWMVILYVILVFFISIIVMRLTGHFIVTEPYVLVLISVMLVVSPIFVIFKITELQKKRLEPNRLAEYGLQTPVDEERVVCGIYDSEGELIYIVRSECEFIDIKSQIAEKKLDGWRFKTLDGKIYPINKETITDINIMQPVVKKFNELKCKFIV